MRSTFLSNPSATSSSGTAAASRPQLHPSPTTNYPSKYPSITTPNTLPPPIPSPSPRTPSLPSPPASALPSSPPTASSTIPAKKTKSYISIRRGPNMPKRGRSSPGREASLGAVSSSNPRTPKGLSWRV